MTSSVVKQIVRLLYIDCFLLFIDIVVCICENITSFGQNVCYTLLRWNKCITVKHALCSKQKIVPYITVTIVLALVGIRLLKLNIAPGTGS